MSWLSTLFSGNKDVTNASKGLMATGSAATGAGMGDTTDASKFFHSILDGDMSSLAPQIQGIQGQGQQKIQTLHQFGNRSGGTNAAVQMTGDTTRSSINDLFAGLSGQAAHGLAGVGSNLLNIGTNATSQGAQLSLENQSMFSKLLQQFANGAGKAVGAAAGGA